MRYSLRLSALISICLLGVAYGFCSPKETLPGAQASPPAEKEVRSPGRTIDTGDASVSPAIKSSPTEKRVHEEDHHYLTTELGIGYSSMLTNYPLVSKCPGSAGGHLQVGYEWQRRQFLLHTGLEFALLNGKTRLQPFALQTPYVESGVEMVENFHFLDFTERQAVGQLSIPVMAGGMFQDRYYFLAGVKIGMPIYTHTKTTTTLRTTLSDPSLIGELGEQGDIPAHNLWTSSEFAEASPAGRVNVQASAEVGISINGLLPKKKAAKRPAPRTAGGKKKKQPLPYYFRVALFCDYGLTNALAAAKSMTDVHTLQGEHLYPAAVSAPRNVLLGTLAECDVRYNSLLVGVKFAALIQMNRPKVVEPPKSYLDVLITDAQTAKTIPAKIQLFDRQTNRETIRDSKNGKAHIRTKVGAFDVTVSALGYLPETQHYEIALLGDNAKLQFALQPIQDSVVEVSQPVVPEKGVIVVLHNLYFATNATTILPQSEKALNELSRMMQAHPEMRIRIVGHTDDVGSEQDNIALSLGRAEAVKRALTERGVEGVRIETEGKGESEPIAPNDSEEGRAENRRVEFVVL